jgi:hypothetical protein
MHAFNAALKITALLGDRRREEEIPHRVPARCATLCGKSMLQQRASG